MKRIKISVTIVLMLWLCSTVTVQAHDAWLSAKLNAKKTHVIIAPVVGEAFPIGEPIMDMKRFIEPTAYFPDAGNIPLEGDPKDSTMLGSFSLKHTCVVASGVKSREITYNDTIAHLYLTEEIGLSETEAAKIITPGVKEFTETYSRYLKTIVSVEHYSPLDSAVGLPLEIILLTWKENPRHQATITFRLLDGGKPSSHAPVRVLSNGKTTIVQTDSNGVAQAIVENDQPVLMAYIKVTKLSENRLQSLWTNLAIYRLEH